MKKEFVQYAGILGLILIVASCKKKNFNEDTTGGGTTTHQVLNITPSYGQTGTPVTIKGKNFGTVTSILELKINNIVLTFTLVNDSTITTTIPKGLGTGTVVVTKQSKAANGPAFEYLYTGNVTTFSGNGDISPLTGTALTVGYTEPIGLCTDAQNNVYVGDAKGLRKIDANGNVTYANITAYANGTGPVGDITAINNLFYYTGPQTHTIFQYNPANVISSSITQAAGNFSAGYLDGTALLDTRFNGPLYISKTSANDILISDINNHCIRKLALGQSVSTYAGSNIAGDVNANSTNARFNQPAGIFTDANNDTYVCDAGNSKIKKISANRDVTMVAGTVNGYQDGPVASAKFNQPASLVKDELGNLLVTDFNNTIRCITASGIVYTVAGSNSFNSGAFADGIGAAAKFNIPVKIIFIGNKTFLISDYANRRIRKMILE